MESDHESIHNYVQHRLSQKEKFDYLDDNTDCLTDAFITLYKSSVRCMQSIYDLVFKSLWQIVSFSKEDIHDGHTTIDMMSMNNSAGDYLPEESFRQLVLHRLPRSSSHHSRQKSKSKQNMLSNKTRVIVRTISNQNLNRVSSNQSPLPESKCTLGTIDSHIIVVPVPSSQCQQLRSENDPFTKQMDFQQSENRNLREELADALCRRSYEPLTTMNRGTFCRHCRPLFFPNVPFHHSEYHSPSSVSQQTSNQTAVPSEQVTHTDNKSETQSYAYSVSPSVQTSQVNPLEEEPISTDTMLYSKMNERNPSILSFPEHDSSASQDSTYSHNSQLKSDAQTLVSDLIQNAQEKYQRILRMSIDRGPQNNTSNATDQIYENQPRSLESKEQNSPKNNTLCQELCKQLSLSNSNQVSEIIRILASNAPHTLKKQPPITNSSIDNSKIQKENTNTLCSELLLHPPFKPKRLIHLCADGSIQVLSAVDDNSNSNQIINPEQYCLNYSNSAAISSIAQNRIFTNESPLPVKSIANETLPIDRKSYFNRMTFIQSSSSTEQSYTKNEVHVDRLVSDDDPTVSFKEAGLNSYHSKTSPRGDEPIVKINLDLHDEITEINREDEENSLPEIFFKRIIAPENSTTPLPEIFNQCKMNRNDEAAYERHKNHVKSRHNRSRSYRNRNVIHAER